MRKCELQLFFWSVNSATIQALGIAVGLCTRFEQNWTGLHGTSLVYNLLSCSNFLFKNNVGRGREDNTVVVGALYIISRYAKFSYFTSGSICTLT